jgi:transcriptional regulator with XRE-family HTH domain
MIHIRPMRLNLARFEQCRADSGMTLAGVAQRAGVNRSSLYRAMNGEHRSASLEFQLRLATVFPNTDLFEPVPATTERLTA